MCDDTDTMDSQHDPPFGAVEVEYHVSAATLNRVKEAYDGAVKEGYSCEFLRFLVDNCHTADHSLHVDRNAEQLKR